MNLKHLALTTLVANLKLDRDSLFDHALKDFAEDETMRGYGEFAPPSKYLRRRLKPKFDEEGEDKEKKKKKSKSGSKGSKSKDKKKKKSKDKKSKSKSKDKSKDKKKKKDNFGFSDS